MKEKMIPMLPPVVNYGVASSLSGLSLSVILLKRASQEIGGLPKITASFQKVNTMNNVDKLA